MFQNQSKQLFCLHRLNLTMVVMLFLVMSSAYLSIAIGHVYGELIFLLQFEKEKNISLILKYLKGHFNGNCGKLS